ncbi:DUF4199 domain-containing protein [Aquimarina sp. ERC-38]|uniref:DUF4199 domain-containing protein n=1 Tax=Aquimarina sp. ERC-38 TaxID=2949996 RepID=UPI002245E418|nr:DUF4199 domain-containing protein [Aquimarina sp. ERC-38]UZO80748.1 DUF4199 domain-containing protein [Aquimarina sp. ERC-38]
MEEQQPDTKKLIVNYGLILGIVSILYSLTIYLTDSYKDPHWSVGILGFIILPVIIYLSIKTYKENNNGFLTLSNALKIGIGVALVGGILSALWNITLTSVIEPEYTQQVLAAQKENALKDSPDLTEEQIDQVFAMTEKLQSPFISFAFGIIGSLFFGFIFSLIIGLIMQKKEELY